MAFTLAAFSESQDSATLVNVAALADPHLTVTGDDISVPNGFSNLGAFYGIGVSLTAAEITSPSLQDRVELNIAPVDVSAEPTSRPPLHDHFSKPIVLEGGEQINALAAEDGAGAQISRVLVWFTDGPLNPIGTEEVLTVRATGTDTLAANAWTNGSLTLDDRLAKGTYALVGMRAEAAGLVAARALIKGNNNARPGVIGFDNPQDIENPMFRNGMLGEWGEFEHDEPPTIDYLSGSADTAETVWLDVIKKS